MRIKNISLLKTLLSFLRAKIPTIITLIAIPIISFIVFYFASIPQGISSYMLILSIFLIFMYLTLSFIGFYRTHKQLTILKENLMLTIDEMPSPSNLIEKDYNEALQKLFELNRTNISKIYSIQSDMNDFYSVWVHQIKVPISAMKLLIQSQERSDFNETLLAELFKI